MSIIWRSFFSVLFDQVVSDVNVYEFYLFSQYSRRMG